MNNHERYAIYRKLKEMADAVGKPAVFRQFMKVDPSLYLDVRVIDGTSRVSVDKHLLQYLDRIDLAALESRLNEKSFRRFKKRMAKIRAQEGRTVGFYYATVTALTPLASKTRATLTINPWVEMFMEPDALRSIVGDDILAGLGERVTVNQLRKAFGLVAGSTDADADGSEEDGDDVDDPDAWSNHRNVIFFGPPGTGKSFAVQEIIRDHFGATDENVFRITFHPEMTYFDFVGTYKPVVGWLRTATEFRHHDGHVDQSEPRAYYTFDPGPFSQALVAALKAPPTTNVIVVIEEINRGNCAAIFGDVFQLLDRVADDEAGDVGMSQYAIAPSAEWSAWLDQQDLPETDAWKGGRLRVPPNLYLYATMNTSDQSLFPMDTAFRRRWGLAYRGVQCPSDLSTRVTLHGRDEAGVLWRKLAAVLNQAIVEHTGTDDKQMGPWFIQSPAGSDLVPRLEFRSKVLFYLWSEVFRDAPERVFHASTTTYDQVVSRYEAGKSVFAKSILDALEQA